MVSRRSFHKLSIATVAAAAVPARAAAQSVAAPPAVEPTRAVDARETLRPELFGTTGMVAAGRHYAVEAGTRILAAGGNAFDAGVAAVFAAAVTEISHFGLGGEAPTIVYEAGTRKVTVISGQGTAPMAATPAYFSKQGVIPGNGPNGGTLPAVVDAMALTLQRFGTLSLATVLEPAIKLADGFPMYAMLRGSLQSNRASTEKWEWSRRTYYPEGRIPEVAEIFRQPNLAATLRAIAAADQAEFRHSGDRVKAIEAGRDVFYKGDVARRIAAAVQADGGLLTYQDLATYKGRLEPSASTTFHGYEIHKAGFWNQGPALLLTFNILDAAGIDKLPHGGEQYLHTLTEAIKLAFDDRNAWFGDPLFADIPAEGLLSRSYAAERAALIGKQASLEHRFGDPYAHQRGGKRPAKPFIPHQLKRPGDPAADTTAIEVVDAQGNLFSCTPSSGWLIGGAYVAGDTGVPLSNRLTIFDLDPASPNVIVGGKRPRTTLSPCIVTRDGKPFLAIGTPGGDNQDQQIANVLLNIILGGQTIQEAIESPRINSEHFHGSFRDKRDDPGSLEIEDRIPAEVRAALKARGHRLKLVGDYGVSTGVVAVGVDQKFGTLRGGADVRRERYAFGW
jgi:gamma-glutamyltranspeptidase/glutathione hydrolase